MTSLKDGDLQHSSALAQSPEGDIEPNHPSEINPNSDSRSRSDGRSRRYVQYRVDQSQGLVISCDESYKYSQHHNDEGVHLCSTMSPTNKTIAFVRSVISCAGHCSLDTNCKTFNYRRFERICQLFYNSNSIDFVIDYVIDDVGCSHYEKVRSARLLFIYMHETLKVVTDD